MKLRIARHTNNINAITNFYIEIIGLKITGNFQGHDGYDGFFLGKHDVSWQLEFTTSDSPAIRQIDEDDLIVFYPEKMSDYIEIMDKIRINKIEIHKPKNPYWRENGVLIKDPDGFGVIICNLQLNDKKIHMP